MSRNSCSDICYFYSRKAWIISSLAFIFYRECVRDAYNYTSVYTHATASVHGALSAAYDGWWSVDKFTALLSVCPERVQEGSVPCIYGCKRFLLSVHAVGHFLSFACPAWFLEDEARAYPLIANWTITRLAV